MTKGKIKAGEGTLIGNAGEYYVVAELLKRSVIAALAPRNAPGFDILATRKGKTAKIRVKTKSEAFSVWQWNAKKDGKIFHDLLTRADFTVLVNLTMDHHDLAFYILPTDVLHAWLLADFQTWLDTPGKGGKPHNPENMKRHLDYNKYQHELEMYHNNWGLLWEECYHLTSG